MAALVAGTQPVWVAAAWIVALAGGAAFATDRPWQGPAAVITPVSHVKSGDGDFTIADGEPGEVTMALRDTLTGIQRGTFADTHDWMTRLG